ncbi:MAG: hypothetical protein AAFX87_25555 [Bacteroidota bacterium]
MFSYKKSLSSFVVKLTVITVILVLLVLGLTELGGAFLLPSQTAPVFIFLFLITIGAHALLLFALGKDPQNFVTLIILSLVLKLVLYGIFNFFIIYLDPQIAVPNIILFFSIYVIYIVFEVIEILKAKNMAEKAISNG